MKGRRALPWLAAAVVASSALVLVLVGRSRSSAVLPLPIAGAPADPERPSPLLVSREGSAEATDERRVASVQAEGRGLVLAVCDDEGVTLAAAEVILFRGSETIAHGETDPKGELALDILGEPARAVVRTAGRAPSLHELPAQAERHEIRLPRGETVAGLLLVDGEAPREPAALSLVGDHPWIEFEELPQEVRQILLAESLAAVSMGETTGAEGSFAFRGLPAGRAWAILLPDELRATRVLPEGRIEGRLVRFERALQGIVLETAALPVLTGRFVDRVTREPVAGITGSLRLRSEGGDMDLGVGPSDEQGRFRRALPTAEFLAGELQIDPSAAHEPRELRFERASAVDLGEIELEPVLAPQVETSVRVLDLRGAPVSGAVLLFVEDPNGILARTDASGSAVLRGREGWQEVFVYALGFHAARERLPGPRAGPAAADPWSIVLAPAPLVTLEVEAGAGRSFEGIGLTLASSGALLEEAAAGGFDQFARPASVGATAPHAARRGRGGSSAEYLLDGQGRARIQELVAGIPIVATLRDGIGAELHRFPEFVLEDGERRELRHRLEVLLGRFEGRVADEQGRPIFGATVRLTSAGSGRSYASSDETGRVRFENLSASSFTAEVQKQGYVAWSGEGLAMPPEGPYEFRLARGRSVRVRVVDEDGEPVEATVSGSSSTEPWIPGVREEAGVVRLDDLGPEVVHVTAEVGGRSYERHQRTDEPECEIRVPNHGHVRARLPESQTVSPEEAVYLVLAPGAPELPHVEIWVPPGSEGVIDLGPVLPGSYEAFLAAPGEQGESSRRALTPPRPITVEARAETLVDL